MKPGDLVEWLEQALTGAAKAAEAEKKRRAAAAKREPTSVSSLRAIAKAVGLRDVEVSHAALADEVTVSGVCRRGHPVSSRVDGISMARARMDQQVSAKIVRSFLCLLCEEP